MIDNEPTWRKGLRALIKHKLKENGPMTTRELANACQVNDTAIAPRMTELEWFGEVVDTGQRRNSVSGRGRKRKVWDIRSACHFSPNEQQPELNL